MLPLLNLESSVYMYCLLNETYKQSELLLLSPPPFRAPGCPPAAEERVQGRAGEDACELPYDSR